MWAADVHYRIFDVLLKPASGHWSFGFGHRYATLNFDDLTPHNNAHLHTSYFPVHRIHEGNHTSFRASVAPALSASSNIMGRPQEYRSDTFQFLFALAWQRQLAGWKLRYGICGDHRFGEYLVYPSIGAVWEPHPDWTLDVGFPDSRLTYRINQRFSSGIGVAPEGNNWHVADSSMTEESRLLYEGYVIDWQLQWDAMPAFTISAGLGATMDSRYELTLIDRNRIRVGADPVLRVSAGLRWKF